MSKNSGHEKAPSVAALEASGNVNQLRKNVMGDNSTNVIPFNFGKQQVRTLLIDGEPWFVASDVCDALELAGRSRNFTRMLDEDEKGAHIVSTPGGSQEVQVVNESGLYALIFKSRKAEAKRFKKWVTAEVLPAIRKQGRYDDAQAKMPTLMDELIGMSELSVIKGLIRDKAKAVTADKRQGFALTMHNRLHTRFNVPRTELIPAGQFEAACNFIAAYSVLEGEFIAKEPPQLQLPLSTHYPLEALTQRRPEMLEHRGQGQAWLDVSMSDICSRPQDLSLCEKILCELRDAGYEIDGAWYEVRSLRNRLHQMNSFLTGLGAAMQQPTRYAVEVSKGRAAA